LSPPETERTHWPAVLAALAAGLAIAFNVGKVPVALPTMRAELGLSLVQAGWVSSTLTSVSFMLAAIAGMWVGRLGALRMVLAGLVVCATASLATVLVQGFVGLLVCRFFEGLGFMAVAVSCPALVSAAADPSQRRFALGLWSSYMPAGAGLVMASAPWLLPATGWRGLWVLTTAALLAAMALLWRQRRHYGPLRPMQLPSDLSFFAPVRQALARPLPWLLSLAFGMWATQHFALIVWMPTWLAEQRAMAAAPIALLTGFMLIMCVPGNLLGGLLVQRGVPRGLLIAAGQGLAGLLAWGYSSDAWSDGWRYTMAVGVSFTGGVIPAAVMASSTVLAKSPQQIGTLQGLFTQGAQIGQFVGTPLIAAVVVASGSWTSALWVTGGAAIVGVALGLAAHRIERGLSSAA